MANADDLAGIALFESLDDAQRAELAGWFELKHVSEGVRLVGEGASGYSFFVLLDGTATVTADGKTLSDLGPGDFFGEIAILGEGRRTASVTTTSPASVLVMFGTEFRRLQQQQPEIAARIEQAMQRRLQTPS